MKNKLLLVSLIFPITALLGLTVYKQNILASGLEYKVVIEGYDPRDLISGHYLLFRYKFDIPNLCTDSNYGQPINICLADQTVSYDINTNCPATLVGFCDGARFTTGHERFYIPQERGLELEQKIRDGKAEVVLSVRGQSEVIKDLLINGKSWKEK